MLGVIAGRLSDAWAVLRGYQLNYTRSEDFDGPVRRTDSSYEEGSYISVAGKRTEVGDIIVVQTEYHTEAMAEYMHVMLTPATARSFAAGILSACDEVDGTPAMWESISDQAIADFVAGLQTDDDD